MTNPFSSFYFLSCLLPYYIVLLKREFSDTKEIVDFMDEHEEYASILYSSSQTDKMKVNKTKLVKGETASILYSSSQTRTFEKR